MAANGQPMRSSEVNKLVPPSKLKSPWEGSVGSHFILFSGVTAPKLYKRLRNTSYYYYI